MGLPEKTFLKRCEILAADIGITDYDFRKVCDVGLLHRVIFPGCKYAKYKRKEVIKVFRIKQGEKE